MRAHELFWRWLRHRNVERVQFVLLPLALLYAAYLLAKSVHPHYPIQHWLVWRYAGYWLACCAFSIACLSAGQRVLHLLGRGYESLRTEIVTSFGLGVLVFFWCVFLFGLFGLLHKPAFFVLPLLLTLSGGRPAWRLLRRSLRLARAKPQRRATPLGRILVLGAAVVGFTALLLIYGQILIPENASFDARWYHLGLAEQYASAGAIRRFPEGAYFGAYPQLASVLYTWAFLVPTGAIFDRVVLAAHLEFTLFIWTLAGVTVLVHRLVPRVRPRFAWVSIFLFPGLFIYDSSLACGADHVVAFFAPLILIALFRALSAPSVRSWFLVAAFLSGACLTKYTAFTLVLFPVLALTVKAAAELVRSFRQRQFDRQLWRAPAVLVAGGLVMTAPHWLKNWIWYGNPIYPMAARWFANRPWAADAERAIAGRDMARWSPQGPLAQKLEETIKALYSFSFEPHDFPRMHGIVPMFGSLFTLCLFVLPFLRGTKRTWMVVVAAHLGVFGWYWTHHEDRYLQALVPWMAAAVAAVVALAWHSHTFARVAVAILVGLQLAWGGDVPFIPAHRMVKNGVLAASINLLSSGYRSKNYSARLDVFGSTAALGKSLPKDAHLLFHEHNPRLGINRVVVTDVPFIQGGLHYGSIASPQALYEQLRAMGVTHVAWRNRSRGLDTYAGDLLFFDFVTRHTADHVKAAGFEVARIVESPAPSNTRDDVLYLGCPRKGFPQGVYRRVDLNVRKTDPQRPKPQTPVKNPEEVAALVHEVPYIVVEPSCLRGGLPATVSAEFLQVATRDKAQLWVRKPVGFGRPPVVPRPGSSAPAPIEPDDTIPGEPFETP